MRLRGAARKTPGKVDLRSRALRQFGRSHGAATASAFAPLLAASARPVAPAATAVARSDLWVVICCPLVRTRRHAKGEARWPGGHRCLAEDEDGRRECTPYDYIDHSANSVCLSPRESPVVYVWSTGAARGVSSRNPSHWLRSCTL
jgi:hypothetical protein